MTFSPSIGRQKRSNSVLCGHKCTELHCVPTKLLHHHFSFGFPTNPTHWPNLQNCFCTRFPISNKALCLSQNSKSP